jgi:hypothetical protein
MMVFDRPVGSDRAWAASTASARGTGKAEAEAVT